MGNATPSATGGADPSAEPVSDRGSAEGREGDIGVRDIPAEPQVGADLSAHRRAAPESAAWTAARGQEPTRTKPAERAPRGIGGADDVIVTATKTWLLAQLGGQSERIAVSRVAACPPIAPPPVAALLANVARSGAFRELSPRAQCSPRAP